jgi:hypothetical protein
VADSVKAASDSLSAYSPEREGSIGQGRSQSPTLPDRGFDHPLQQCALSIGISFFFNLA